MPIWCRFPLDATLRSDSEDKRHYFTVYKIISRPVVTYKSSGQPRTPLGWSVGRPRFLPQKDIINVVRECCKTSITWTRLAVSQYHGVYVWKVTIARQHWLISLAGNDLICQSVRELPTPSSGVPRVHAPIECACSMAVRACGTCNRESSGTVNWWIPERGIEEHYDSANIPRLYWLCRVFLGC